MSMHVVVKNLSVRYTPEHQALHELSFQLRHGERLGIIGESGSGKTTLALSLLGLLPPLAQMEGEVLLDGEAWLSFPASKQAQWRWHRIAIVFQNQLDVLNPVLSIGEQVVEAIQQHLQLSKKEAWGRGELLFNQVGLDPKWMESYPHQLSGGMRQRVLIAMGLSCEPELLILDEPTTALDAMAKQEIVELLRRLQQERGFTMITISHEFPVVAQLADQLLVLNQGVVMEQGPTSSLLEWPRHPYTKGLVRAAMVVNPYQDLWGIPDEGPLNQQDPAEYATGTEGEPLVQGKMMNEQESATACPFATRCFQALPICCKQLPPLVSNQHGGEQDHLIACHRGGIITLLAAKNLVKTYRDQKLTVPAVQDCSLHLHAGEVAALVGASGSGKTTLAQMLGGLLPPDAGTVQFMGEPVINTHWFRQRNGIQMVHQDPFTATNGSFTVADVITEPLRLTRAFPKAEWRERLLAQLHLVQLPTSEEFLQRKANTLSGGQRQRVAVARALIMQPQVLLADEMSAMLDPSTQANILRLLKGLQNRFGFSMLYITHDLRLARKIADTIYVMYQGKIVEHQLPAQLFTEPEHPFTQELVAKML